MHVSGCWLDTRDILTPFLQVFQCHFATFHFSVNNLKMKISRCGFTEGSMGALDPLGIFNPTAIGCIANEISLTADFPEFVLRMIVLCLRKDQVQS